MREITPENQRLIKLGILDPRTGELTSYGEMVAEERYRGTSFPSDDGDPRFGEMGPDLMPGTNVVGV